MNQYRISGWFRDSLGEEIGFHFFEADNDKSAWAYELPPKFLSNALERKDGDEWVALRLSSEDFAAALNGVVKGLLK